MSGISVGPPPTTEIVKTVTESGSALTIKLAEGTAWNISQSADCTFTFPTAERGKSFELVVTPNGHSQTWPANVIWPGGVYPSLGTGPNPLSFQCIDGEHWEGFLDGKSMAAGGSAEAVAPAAQTAITAEETRAKRAERGSGAASTLWVPSGYKEENMPRAWAGNVDYTLVSGQAHLFAGPTLRPNVEYTKIAVQIGSVAASVPTHSFVVLCNQNREILKMGKDKTSTAIGSFRLFEFELESVYKPTEEIPCYVTVVSVATTPFSLRGNQAASQNYGQPYVTGKSPNWTGVTTPASLVEKGACGTLESPAVVATPYCCIG
jgi:hypothetical protein